MLGKHRKLMPTAMEWLVLGFGDGSTLPASRRCSGRLGAVICSVKLHAAFFGTADVRQVIELDRCPHSDDRDTRVQSPRHIALVGAVFVLLPAASTSKRGDCPEDYAAIQVTIPQTVLMRGGSCIVGPLGQVLAGPDYDGERILSRRVGMRAICTGKERFRCHGALCETEAFRLFVNVRPRHLW